MAYINNLYHRFRASFSSAWPKTFNYCEQHKSIIKFFITGSLAGVTDLIFLYFFHQVLGRDIIISTSLAFIISFIISFGGQKLWTFRNYSQNKLPRQLILYIANAFFCLALNGLAMHYLVNSLELWYLLAQVIVSLSLAVINFVNYKYIIFRSDKHENKIS